MGLMMTRTTQGACVFCGAVGRLCVSHAIPDAFGRRIRRESSGYFLIVSKGERELRKSSDRGGSKLLCENCERLFNNSFDQYIVNTVRLIRNKFENQEKLEFSISCERLIRAYLSVIWRASHSDESLFSHLVPLGVDDPLRRILYQYQEKLSEHFALSICIVAGISEHTVEHSLSQHMRDVIVPPILSGPISLSPKGKGVSYRAFAMLIEGIYFLLISPRPGYPKNRSRAFMQPDAKLFSPPVRPLLELPFVNETILDVIETAFWNKSGHHSASSS